MDNPFINLNDFAISSQAIEKQLQNGLFGNKIECFQQVVSTNDVLKDMADCGAVEGTVVLADQQSNGKGRLGRVWESAEGGIWMSLLLRPNMPAMQASQITLVAAVAVCRAIFKHLKQSAVSNQTPFVKWPNDIVLNGKKLCGILSELRTDDKSVQYVVCGIGINVNQTAFPEEIKQTATSLFLETGALHNRNEIVAYVLNEFSELYLDFVKNGLTNLLEEYKAVCINIGKDVKVQNGTMWILGKAVEIGTHGELILQTENDERKAIVSGEVSVRGLNGYI